MVKNNDKSVINLRGQSRPLINTPDLKQPLMCEGPSFISGPIPPDPSLFPEYYRRPVSACGRLEGNTDGTLALLSGPLAPDPVLYPGYYSARTPPRPPRISPNAAHILERGQRGVVGELLKLDGVSIIPSTPKKKQLVHDFGKENIRRMREVQKRCKEQEARSRLVPVKALWTSSKYQSIPSKLTAQLQNSIPAVKPQCQNFLRAHSNYGSGGSPKPECKASPSAVQCCASRNSTQDQTLQLRIEGQGINFIQYNARAAGKTVLRRSQSLTNLKDNPVPSAVKGQVPRYLSNRKEQWRKEEEERRKNAPDPTAPAGHTLMPERKRQETLESLKETHGSLLTELLSFPIRADSLSVRARQGELDRRLSEIEEAIKIFSRDKVYIKMDS